MSELDSRIKKVLQEQEAEALRREAANRIARKPDPDVVKLQRLQSLVAETAGRLIARGVPCDVKVNKAKYVRGHDGIIGDLLGLGTHWEISHLTTGWHVYSKVKGLGSGTPHYYTGKESEPSYESHSFMIDRNRKLQHYRTLAAHEIVTTGEVNVENHPPQEVKIDHLTTSDPLLPDTHIGHLETADERLEFLMDKVAELAINKLT